MKTRTKVLILALAAILLVVTTVFATVAYLKSSVAITNTFTVGNVTITMDEAVVDKYGVAADINDRQASGVGNEYKLIPGHEYTKDPIIRVDAGSEDCWVFITVDINGVGEALVEDCIVDQLTDGANWVAVTGSVNGYAYKTKVTGGTNVDTFTTFTLKDDADVSGLATVKDGEGVATTNFIKVTGYAVQADGFNTAQEAWTATFGAPVAP